MAPTRDGRGQHDETTLRLAAFGRATAVRQELHVPLVYGDRAVGVASLGRTAPGTVDPRGRELMGHLAEMAAISISDALTTTRRGGWPTSTARSSTAFATGS